MIDTVRLNEQEKDQLEILIQVINEQKVKYKKRPARESEVIHEILKQAFEKIEVIEGGNIIL